MGRGDRKEQRDLSKKQMDYYNQWLNEQRMRQEQAAAPIRAQAENLINDPGYSPEEQAAILQESMGATGAAFDTARDRGARRLARTRNSAGYGDLVSELAREEGRGKARTAQDAQIRFADEKQKRRLQGLALLQQLYGIDTNLLGGTSGLPLGALGEHSKGVKQGDWWDPVIGGAASVGSAFLGG